MADRPDRPRRSPPAVPSLPAPERAGRIAVLRRFARRGASALNAHERAVVAKLQRPVLKRILPSVFTDELRLPRQTLSEWRDRGAPVNAENTICLGDMWRWREDDLRKQHEARLPEDADAKRRRETAEADMAEMKRDRMKKSLVGRDSAEAERREVAQIFVASLERLAKDFRVAFPVAPVDHGPWLERWQLAERERILAAAATPIADEEPPRR